MAAFQSSPFQPIDKNTYRTFSEKTPFEVKSLDDRFFLQAESEMFGSIKSMNVVILFLSNSPDKLHFCT
jgi:hypothetical protein